MKALFAKQPRPQMFYWTTRKSGNWVNASCASLRFCRRSQTTCCSTRCATTCMSWPPLSLSSTTAATAWRRTGKQVGSFTEHDPEVISVHCEQDIHYWSKDSDQDNGSHSLLTAYVFLFLYSHLNFLQKPFC